MRRTDTKDILAGAIILGFLFILAYPYLYKKKLPANNGPNNNTFRPSMPERAIPKMPALDAAGPEKLTVEMTEPDLYPSTLYSSYNVNLINTLGAQEMVVSNN